MEYNIYVDSVKGSYSKAIDVSRDHKATLGRTSRDNNPDIKLEYPIISRQQGCFYLSEDGKLIYQNTSEKDKVIPSVINGEPIDPERHTTEMKLETILNFANIFKVGIQPIPYQEPKKEEQSSDECPTMMWPEELNHLLKK